MMRKAILLFLCIPLVTLFSCINSNDENLAEEHSTVTTGRFLIADDGSYIIIVPDYGPIVMANKTDNEDVFDNMQTGDKIKVSYYIIADSYPGQTEIYSCELIEKGGFEDIMQDDYAFHYNQLKELGLVS
jgi:hypothetical protein